MNHLAIDIGNTSGRVSLAGLARDRLTIIEIARFPNIAVEIDGHLTWDVLHLVHQIKSGVRAAVAQTGEIASLGIDTWGVDFALLDRAGQLLANPRHHRDPGNRAGQRLVHDRIVPADLFARTGVQDLPVNSLFQLAALQQERPWLLKTAAAFLMMADFLRWSLTGEIASEYTLATTSQLINVETRDWDLDLIGRLGLPVAIFPRLIAPGTMSGTLTDRIAAELAVPRIPAVAVAQHDTACAVHAVPGAPDAAWLSLGTWGLLGTNLPAPLCTEAVRQAGLTNEGGATGQTRLLRNLTGLWLYERCRAAWSAAGAPMSHDDLTAAIAGPLSLQHLFDPDDPELMNPPDMPAAICHLLGEPSLTTAEVLHAITCSLAFKVAAVLDQLEHVTGRRFPGLHVVGGGARNEPLCLGIATAIGRPVWAGPAEATTIGNALMQMRALGAIAGTTDARNLVLASFPPKTFEPEHNADWDDARARFQTLTNG